MERKWIKILQVGGRIAIQNKIEILEMLKMAEMEKGKIVELVNK